MKNIPYNLKNLAWKLGYNNLGENAENFKCLAQGIK